MSGKIGVKILERKGPIGLDLYDGWEGSAVSVKNGSSTPWPVALSNVINVILASLEQYFAI